MEKNVKVYETLQKNFRLVKQVSSFLIPSKFRMFTYIERKTIRKSLNTIYSSTRPKLPLKTSRPKFKETSIENIFRPQMSKENESHPRLKIPGEGCFIDTKRGVPKTMFFSRTHESSPFSVPLFRTFPHSCGYSQRECPIVGCEPELVT